MEEPLEARLGKWLWPSFELIGFKKDMDRGGSYEISEGS